MPFSEPRVVAHRRKKVEEDFMKDKQTWICTLCVLLGLLSGSNLYGQRILASLEILAFSEDSRYVAYETYSDISAIGDAVPDGWILVRDIITKETVDSFRISDFIANAYERRDDPEMKALLARNRKMREDAINELKRRGFVFEVGDPAPMGSVSIEMDEKRLNPKDPTIGHYRLTFFLKEGDTGYRLNIGEAMVTQNRPGSISIGGFVPTPDSKNYIVLYQAMPTMEFDPGKKGDIIVSRYDLALFFNGVGFAYYKRKNISWALENFKAAYEHNERFEKASYNIACMYALQSQVEQALEYLRKLEALDTEAARKLLQQAKKDSDFNKIRSDRRFQDFMGGL
jgi:hypothetical protein